MYKIVRCELLMLLKHLTH